jgi:RES domain-containing protein
MPEFEPAILASIHATPFIGTAYRNQAPGFDPTSGEGARRQGGRFNPPHSFPVLYLCATRLCVVAELMQQAARQGLDVVDLLPRELWSVLLDLETVLDLSDAGVQRRTGLEVADLTRPDHGFTREIGEFAHDKRFQAIRSPSATGVDEIIAVFPENLGAATLNPRLEKVFSLADDVNEAAS